MRREFAAGGVVYRDIKGERKWLVRRPSGGKGYRGNMGWSLPKGWLDDSEEGNMPGAKGSGAERASEEEIQEAARREVREEGGVEVRVVRKLPTQKWYYKNDKGEQILKFVTYYVMEWEKDVPGGWGWETEEARWVSEEEVGEMLAYHSEKKMFMEAVRDEKG